MFANYIKLAFKVLARKKFFTFISLFGTSFTLMVLMLIAAYLETQFGSNPPISDNQRLIFTPFLSQLYYENDTIKKRDTIDQNGRFVIDSTIQVKRRDEPSSVSMSGFSRRLLEQHFSHIDGVEAATFMSPHSTFDVYRNNSKMTIRTALIDVQYWKVFDFVFTEGRPINDMEIKNNARVAVVTEKLAKHYFGEADHCLGKEIGMDEKNYRIVGVVKPPRPSGEYINSDAFIPYTVYPEKNDPDDYFGAYMAIYKIRDGQDIQAVKRRIEQTGNKLPVLRPDQFNAIESKATTYRENFAQELIYDEDGSRAWRKVLLIMGGFIALFVILPVLNLVNLNISRVMERSSEIGVRKAFGAHTGNILFQFVFENIVQTLLGGIIGLILAIIAIYFINTSLVLDNVKLTVNITFFITCFLIAILFGIFSGLLPAWKMSRLPIVNALKQHKI